MCETGALRVCCGDKLALLHHNGRLMSNGYEARAHAHNTARPQVAVLVYTLYHERDTAKRDKCATHDNTSVPGRARPGRVGRHTVGEGGRGWWRGALSGGMSK